MIACSHSKLVSFSFLFFLFCVCLGKSVSIITHGMFIMLLFFWINYHLSIFYYVTYEGNTYQ
jgi:hypothetical protein